jgi:uncharacterized protein (TIGR00369 family)
MGRMTDEEHYRKLERMYASAPVNALFSPRLRVGESEAEVVIPIHPGLFHAAGAAHGSVYFKAMDDAAFFAANSLVKDYFVLTASFTLYFLRPVSSGEIRAVGRVAHRSRKQFIADAELFDSEGTLIGRGSGAFVRSRLRLSGALGYE